MLKPLAIVMTLSVSFVLLVESSVSAQPSIDKSARNALVWDTKNQRKADIISTVLVAAALALPCSVNGMRADTRWTCLENEGIRVGLGIGGALLVKRLVHRVRPDGSDDKSFFSGHTVLACAATVRTKFWALCPAVAYGRVAANKHWLTDVGTGAAVGGVLAYSWK